MHVVSEDEDGAVVRFTPDELMLVNNALNEVSNGLGIPDWEFGTRLGATRESSRALLAEFHHLLDRLRSDSAT